MAEPTTRYTTVPSPVGDLLLTAGERAVTGLHMAEHRCPQVDASWRRDDDGLAGIVAQLDEYFAGRRRDFDVELSPSGTRWQLEVWAALRTIPYGSTVSYGELARRVGNPRASRAVGLANNRNPIAIIIPCHRVIGADGSLTGYGGGLDNKRLLLELETAGTRLEVAGTGT